MSGFRTLDGKPVNECIFECSTVERQNPNVRIFGVRNSSSVVKQFSFRHLSKNRTKKLGFQTEKKCLKSELYSSKMEGISITKPFNPAPRTLIWTIRNPNTKKFRFWHFTVLVHSKMHFLNKRKSCTRNPFFLIPSYFLHYRLLVYRQLNYFGNMDYIFGLRSPKIITVITKPKLRHFNDALS